MGVVAHPLYHTWRGMIRRCEDPKDKCYQWYGDIGIKVCAEWHTFSSFETWIMENLGPRPEGMTLDRIDVWGNYEPGNLRWATQEQQRENRRPPWWDLPPFPERRKKPTGHRHVQIGDGCLVAVECTDLACPGN